MSTLMMTTQVDSLSGYATRRYHTQQMRPDHGEDKKYRDKCGKAMSVKKKEVDGVEREWDGKVESTDQHQSPIA